MILLTYDITNNKIRTKFAKFLEKYGTRLQYSVFTIKNSPRILRIVKTEIETKFKKKFKDTDSVLIFEVSERNAKRALRYGYESHWNDSVLYY